MSSGRIIYRPSWTWPTRAGVVVALVFFFALRDASPALAALTLVIGVLAGLVGAGMNRNWLREEAERRRRGRCIFCGYDLRGSGNRCPECGRERG